MEPDESPDYGDLRETAYEETNAEGVTVESIEDGVKVRLMFHPPEKHPVLVPCGQRREKMIYAVLGFAKTEQRLTYEQVQERYSEKTDAEIIDLIDRDHWFEVQLVYYDEDPAF